MGTDYVELLDRGTAELIVHASQEVLATLVESRTRPLTGSPVWREYFDPKSQTMREFPPDVSPVDRLRALLEGEMSLPEIKSEAIRELCTSEFLYLDYWGCMAEVFSTGVPPGCTTWDDFTAPMFGAGSHEESIARENDEPLIPETSGSYILTSANTRATIQSLKDHMGDLRVMRESDIAKLERWHDFCRDHHRFSIVYQIDF